jgi:hypothetical protein
MKRKTIKVTIRLGIKGPVNIVSGRIANRIDKNKSAFFLFIKEFIYF